MFKIIKKLRVLLDRKQKNQMVGLVFLMLIGAILEAFSVAAILPVVKVVLTPDTVLNNKYIAGVYNAFHFPNEKVFGVVIMVALVIIFVVKNIFIHWEYKLLYRFIFTNQFSTSELKCRYSSSPTNHNFRCKQHVCTHSGSFNTGFGDNSIYLYCCFSVMEQSDHDIGAGSVDNCYTFTD